MRRYNLTEYIDFYSKASERLWQNYRDEPALENNNNIIDFSANNNSISLTRKTENNDRKDVEKMVPLKHLSNFQRNLEIPLINCEISLILIFFQSLALWEIQG